MNKVIKGSLLNALSTLCGTVLSNSIDPQTAFFSYQWIKHVFLVSFVLIIFNEARYYKQWADKQVNILPIIVLSFISSFIISGIMVIVFRLSHT